MKRIFLLLLCVIASCIGAVGSMAQDKWRLRIMEYNCENLFDTCHDYGKDDSAFTPAGEYNWNTGRYWKKLGNLARVVLEAGGLQPVDIVGLCEVENDSVLSDLVRRTRMASLGYEYVVTHSQDLRGIDVALLYQPATFRLVSTDTHSIAYDTLHERPTRDVLHCAGVLPTGDTLDVVVVHFPSRRGGVRATEDYRLRAAGVVCGVVDSLMLARRQPAIVVMGDCNDEPSDRSLQRISQCGMRNLSACATAIGNGTSERQLRQIQGTYYFRQAWSRIDNILVSDAAAERFSATECCIFAPDYLLETDADGFVQPYRLYRGPIYHGGVSDHLPLLLDLWY